jgi:cytochrome c
VRFEWPPNGGVADVGESIAYRLKIEDAEDGVFVEGSDAGRLIVQPLLGHDTHAHPSRQSHAAEGTVQLESEGGEHPEMPEVDSGSNSHAEPDDQGAGAAGGHGEGANIFTVISATYTDRGSAGVRALTSRAEVVLQPRRKQAEHFSSQSGIVLEKCEDEGGGVACAFIENGDWVSYAPVNLSGVESIRLRVASAAAADVTAGSIELRMGAGAQESELVETVTVKGTAGWQKWMTLEVALDDAARSAGTSTLWLVFKGEGKSSLFNVNWIEFVGEGVAKEPRR